jgi:alkylation response protein AidB-like acyl-CoA dehydrogenase
MTLPAEMGGIGCDALTSVLLLEALSHGCGNTGLVFSIAAHIYACIMPILKLGTEEQKRRWLPGLGDGSIIAAHSITEPEAGSDIFAMSTRAVRDGDRYILDGIKCFATNAPIADLLLVHAATGTGKGFFDISAFLVETSSPGVTIGRPHHKTGLNASPMSDIYLDACAVPATSRLGKEGAGASIFMYSMNWERACLFATYIGAMQRQLDATLEYARSRRQFDQPIAKLQAVSHRIVDMKVRLEAARLLLYRAAWSVDQNPSDATFPSIAKLFISEAAVQSGLDAIQVHGGYGVISGEIERSLRDAIPSRIFSGTSEVQRNTIARALRL